MPARIKIQHGRQKDPEVYLKIGFDNLYIKLLIISNG